MRLVLISDTHNRQDQLALPEGDVLVHAGDFTMSGTEKEIATFGDWLGVQGYAHKVLIAGNHDLLFESDPERARSLIPAEVHYLRDAEVTIEGLRFYGAPWQPWFLDWAFNLARGPEIAARWALIPNGVDVLITHGPPQGVGDRTYKGENVGCVDLAATMERVKPRLSVFGHIHEGYGVYDNKINASICDERYRVVHRPVVVDIDCDGQAPRVIPESAW